MTSETYFDKLKQIDFYSKEIHPELIPFVGTDYSKYRILQIGESHFISNYPEGSHGKHGNVHNRTNVITLDDFNGWWNGELSERLREQKGSFNTNGVVNYYIGGHRDRSDVIFTNPLKSFCKVVTPDEAFETISN